MLRIVVLLSYAPEQSEVFANGIFQKASLTNKSLRDLLVHGYFPAITDATNACYMKTEILEQHLQALQNIQEQNETEQLKVDSLCFLRLIYAEVKLSIPADIKSYLQQSIEYILPLI